MGTPRIYWSRQISGSLWGQGEGAGPSPIYVTRPQGEEFVFPPEGGAGGDGRTACTVLSRVLLGVALRPGAVTQSPRAGGGTRLTPSSGARLGGRWVWGGSGAGDGGGRRCGGSGTSGRSPGSAVRWAGECRREWRTPSRPHWGQAGLGSELWRKWPPRARCPADRGSERGRA